LFNYKKYIYDIMSRVARKIINYRTSVKHNPLIRYYIDYFRNELNALNPTESE